MSLNDAWCVLTTCLRRMVLITALPKDTVTRIPVNSSSMSSTSDRKDSVLYLSRRHDAITSLFFLSFSSFQWSRS